MTETQETSFPSDIALVVVNHGGPAYNMQTVTGTIQLIDTVYGRQIIPYTVEKVQTTTSVDTSHIIKDISLGDINQNEQKSIIWTLLPMYTSKIFKFAMSTQHQTQLADWTPTRPIESYHTLIRQVTLVTGESGKCIKKQ